MKRYLRPLTGLMASSLIGALLVLPSIAQARCPSIGDKGLSGDCSPRSTQCYKSWVVDHRVLNGVPHYKLLVYRRYAAGSWAFVSETWYPC